MKIKTVLFDLDGTLTDSGPGIINSVHYALEKMGMKIDDKEKLRHFVGPPLKDEFQKFCGISEEEGTYAVSLYREYYTETGIFENEVYEGIYELLKALKEEGMQIAMATSKPEKFAKIIAEHFGLAPYFDFVGGGQLDGTRTKKSEVIDYVVDACCVTDRSTVLMIGDREYDILGAKTAGVQSVGVLYGYGDRAELEGAGADFIAATPKDVLKVIF